MMAGFDYKNEYIINSHQKQRTTYAHEKHQPHKGQAADHLEEHCGPHSEQLL